MYTCSTCGSSSEKEAGVCHGAERQTACDMCGLAKSSCACWCWIVGKILMALGLVAAIAAWVTGAYATTWAGMDSDGLFHTSIVLLLLGIICVKNRRGHHGGGHQGGCQRC